MKTGESNKGALMVKIDVNDEWAESSVRSELFCSGSSKVAAKTTSTGLTVQLLSHVS